MALASAFSVGFALRCAVACTAAFGAFAVPPACAATAPATNNAAHPYAAPVAEAAQRFGIPELWIWRVMHAESRGNRGAVSHAGAIGLMQIMPATWTMLSARHRLGNDPFNVRANILAGAAYLRAMWDRYRDVRLMLAAYNAGPGRADAFAAGRRGLPAETIAYVRRIAPELGTSDPTSSVLAPAPTVSNWRDASLFAARPLVNDRGETRAGSLPMPREEAAPPSAINIPTAPSNSLFVLRSGSSE